MIVRKGQTVHIKNISKGYTYSDWFVYSSCMDFINKDVKVIVAGDYPDTITIVDGHGYEWDIPMELIEYIVDKNKYMC